jgi:tyrosine 2,3-aminomutase
MYAIRGSGMTIDHVGEIAARHEKVALPSDVTARVAAAHAKVQEWGAQERPMYGVNTGFGEMAHVAVPAHHRTTLQVNLLRGHAAGAGEAFPAEVARAIILARANSLAKGHSGVSPQALEMLATFLNEDVTPVIPEQGSLGASGDLSPLSHMALPLIGEGEVFQGGQRVPAGDALAKLGLKPLVMGYKEGLALVNGTSAMTGTLSIVLLRAYDLLNLAVLLAGLTTQCLRGSRRAFDASGHELKGHPGQIAVAARIRQLLAGSSLTVEHAELMSAIEQKRHLAEVTPTGVYLQSAYSVRCTPQILGPVVETMRFAQGTVERELNSCNDNPLVFDAAEESFHGGNFHGQYVAMAADYLAIALVEIGVLAERQLNRLVDPDLNKPLPDFLAGTDSGLTIGMMGAQYLATSVASENINLASPSSVLSIPSNGQNQDVVSMGLNAARRCLRIAENVNTILSVLNAACMQAVETQGAELLSEQTRKWFDAVRTVAPPYCDDRPVYQLLDTLRAFQQGQGRDLATKLGGFGPVMEA